MTLELTEVRDGDGWWIGSNPIDGAIDRLGLLNEEHRALWWKEHPPTAAHLPFPTTMTEEESAAEFARLVNESTPEEVDVEGE